MFRLRLRLGIRFRIWNPITIPILTWSSDSEFNRDLECHCNFDFKPNSDSDSDSEYEAGLHFETVSEFGADFDLDFMA